MGACLISGFFFASEKKALKMWFDWKTGNNGRRLFMWGFVINLPAANLHPLNCQNFATMLIKKLSVIVHRWGYGFFWCWQGGLVFVSLGDVVPWGKQMDFELSRIRRLRVRPSQLAAILQTHFYLWAEYALLCSVCSELVWSYPYRITFLNV